MDRTSPTPTRPRRIMAIGEVCRILGVSDSTVRIYVLKGRLQPAYITGSGQLLFEPEEVQRFQKKAAG